MENTLQHWENILNPIADKIKKEGETIQTHTIQTGSYSYNFFIYIYNNEGSKISSTIINIKIRDKHYNNLIIEKKKYNYMKRLYKTEKNIFNKVNLMYINITPKGTYCFNLLDLEYNWIIKDLPQTTINETGEMNKEISDLDITDSDMVLKYNSNELEEIKRKKDNKNKKRKCIFQGV